MKRGGRSLVLSIFSICFTLILTVGTISPISWAVEGDTSTSESTEQTTDEQADNTDDSQNEDSCEAGLWGFGWILCPGQNLVTTVMSWFLGYISDTLNWTMLTDNTDTLRSVWQDFLTIANVVFVIAFLIMIYSMATSTGLSNYDIKKMLPRLIIVAIAVNISFYICAALVDLSNIAGKGVYDLLISHTSGSGWQNLATNAIASALGAAAAAIAIVFLGGAAIIALLIILIAISFRQLALMLLVIVSPIALALYMLPNTKKWGQKWLDFFVRMLLVYPMFMAVWGASQLVSNITATTDSGTTGILPLIINVICSIAPALFILPLFKSTGGIMGTVTAAMAGSSIASKGKTAINSGIQRSRPVHNSRRFISSAALGAQNALGDVPVVGGLLRGPAVNRVVNYERDYAAAQDKKAMESASTWAKGLTSSQLTDLITTGSYTTDKGRRSTITDTHKLRAAIEAGKDNLDAADWHNSMRYINNRAAHLDNVGRQTEAAQLRQAFASNAIASKAMPLPNGGIGAWASTGWNPTNFEAKYGQNAAKFASRLSQSKLSSMTPVAQEDMRRAMYNSLDPRNLSGLNANDIQSIRNDYDNGVRVAQLMANDALKNNKLKADINEGTRAQLESTRDDFRTSTQQDIARKYNLDNMYQSYNRNVSAYQEAVKSKDSNNINRAGNDLLRSTKPAKDLVLQMHTDPQVAADYRAMSEMDRARIVKLNTFTNASPPEPVKTW